MVGGGVVGLCSSLLLARDGHRVRLLERDPAAPPPRDQDPWERWERRGVNQFHLLHAFLPRFRELLDAELPDVTAHSRQTELLGSTASPSSPTR